MITYNEIYEVLRKERYSEQLQPLTKSFIKSVAEYLKDKKKASVKDDDLFSDAIQKTKIQFENALSMFKELMLRRKKKILNLVHIASETGVNKRDFENMLSFEKALFEKIMDAISGSDRELSYLLEGGSKEEDDKVKIVVFKENVDSFLDLDGEKLGPFEKGEIANISKEVAEILVNEGKAEYVEDDS